MNAGHSSEAGFALPVAIFTLVIAGVLATAGFFMSRQEVRIGMASENSTLALYLAENGAADLVGNWDVSLYGSLSTWADTTTTRTYSGLGAVDAKVTRMSSRLYFAELDGTVTRGGAVLSGASRRIGMILRMNSAEIDPPAALTTRGPTAIKGTAEVHGEDVYPPGWGSVCTDPLKDKPGIVTDDSSQVSANTGGGGGGGGKGGGGGGGAANLTGSPALQEDSTVADSTFTQFGELAWADLVALADITLPGGSINGTGPDTTAAGICNSGQAYPRNWGNPDNPDAACGDWFPIVYISASANIQSGGMGQGILLVEGDLDLRGSFVFHGVIIVQGNFETQGSGNRILGGVMASNANFASQSLVGGSVVQNSTCAVTRAILNNSSLTRVRPLNERSFVDLSAVKNN
jgi:hypothetical protein